MSNYHRRLAKQKGPDLTAFDKHYGIKEAAYNKKTGEYVEIIDVNDIEETITIESQQSFITMSIDKFEEEYEDE